VTLLLRAASDGDASASERLLPLVYEELRRIAAGLMQRERQDHTLQPTALVHEAYLRLLGGAEIEWKSKAHFFNASARAMRRILIDHARRVRSAKRSPVAVGGGDTNSGSFDTPLSFTPSVAAADDLIELDTALDRLANQDSRQHEVVMLRYFAGLTIEQTAQTLGVSPGTVKSDWSFARAWLMREIHQTRSVRGHPGQESAR
jgi:RNA polymerase sigma factor (TIGR02999 family)